MNSTLRGKAIQFALNKEWKKASKANKKILESNPQNKKALLRLGKALIHLNNYSEAQKTFEKVLEQDPINKIAKKNLKKIEKKVSVKA
jgi:tetratricopeptide (TPR) repeat protein